MNTPFTPSTPDLCGFFYCNLLTTQPKQVKVDVCADREGAHLHPLPSVLPGNIYVAD